MAGYTLNGNPYGGSFILEGSTDGTSWDVMVAKSSNGTFLGREGLSTGGGNISSGYNSTPFSNTAFSIYKPSGTYYPPDRVTDATYTGTLKQSSTTECKVILSRDPASTGTWEKGLNTKEDFSVNCVLSSATYPYFTPGTACNCVVTNYNSGTGELTFSAKPDISGTCKFGIIIRSGQGTGVISNALITTSSFTVEVDEFAGVIAFASTRTSSWSYTADFLNIFYANMPTTVTFRFYTISSTGTSIPSWQTTLGLNPTSYNVTTNPDSTNQNSPGWGNGANTHITPAETSRRLWWQFSQPKVVTSFVLIMGSIWESKYVNFEIVASTDGVNFVRLPTIWQSSSIEDTFNLYHSRRDKNGDYLWRLMYDGTSYPNLKTEGNPLARVANVYSIYAKGMACNMARITISNSTAYTYYGIGSVGTECPYSSSNRSDTTTRTYARQPCGSYIFVGSVTPTDWDAHAVIAAMSDRTDIAGTNQWSWNYLNIHNLALPQASSASSVTAPTMYKYWRIRASSAFLGACGTTTKAYFWKLGLYRNATLAAADTYGLSSNNYLQQYANVLGISTNGTTPTTQTGTKRDSMFVSKGDWTQQWGSATQFASVNGTTALQNNAVDVIFNAEFACIQFTLDVVGEIGAIRFPDNMYYDANVRGGTFILEASNNSTTWITFVATSSGKYLGREGVLNATPVASGAAGNVALATGYKVFTLTPAVTYNPPTTATPSVSNPSLSYNQPTTNCQIDISGGSWSLNTNTILDFNVHIVKDISTRSDILSRIISTKFNCLVTNYSETGSVGTITFTVTPDVVGSCNFVVFVRNGKTGETSVMLLSPSVTVNTSYVPVSSLSPASLVTSTRVFNGSTYTCIRFGSGGGTGNISVPANMICDILMVGAGGQGGCVYGLNNNGSGAGAGGVAYIRGVQLTGNVNYSISIAGGPGWSAPGGANGQSTTGFGISVKGGGGGVCSNSDGIAGGSGSGGATTLNNIGGAVSTYTGTLTVPGSIIYYGNIGGTTTYSGNIFASGGGGAGSNGGNTSSTSGGNGGDGSSLWSDWCAACGIGERDNSGVFYIAGGGGGSGNDNSGLKAGSGGKGGGGHGGHGNVYTTKTFYGLGQQGIDCSGGGGGGGPVWLYASGTVNFNYGPPGGSGVIIIKQSVAPTTPTPVHPTSNSSWGLQVWLDASDPAGNGIQPADSADITSWIDKSGNSRNATPLVNGKNGKFRLGQNEGLPSSCGAIFISNTSYIIPYTSFNPATYTIFLIFRTNYEIAISGGVDIDFHSVESNICVLGSSSNNQLFIGMKQNYFTTIIGSGSAMYGNTTPQIPIMRQWIIMTMQYTLSTKTTNTWVNGIKFDTRVDSGTQNGGATWNNLYIGQNGSIASPLGIMRGCVAEILIYNTVIVDADRKSLEAWLSQKYGVGFSF